MPKWGDSYGNGAPILVVEVTIHQGERESRLQGEVEQVEMAEKIVESAAKCVRYNQQ